jgi:hypothetical protein
MVLTASRLSTIWTCKRFICRARSLPDTNYISITISIAQDVKLRASIKRAAFQESSKFLCVLSSAQMEKQIEEAAIKISKANLSL